MGVTIKHVGDFKKTEKFFNTIKSRGYLNALERYGEVGVRALSAATPKRSGTTASMWNYEIERNANTTRISWFNENENRGVNIAVIIQHGHGTGTGGWVEGIDYINPAMRPIFDTIADNVWKEVQDA